MNERIKRYRVDHKDIKVYCPCCRKLMSGWTKDLNWDRYWIAHQTPNKKDKECWATPKQMAVIEKEWEKKYEYVEGQNS